MLALYYITFNNESISDDKVRNAVEYDRHFQPHTELNRYKTESNEAEGKKYLQSTCVFDLCLF